MLYLIRFLYISCQPTSGFNNDAYVLIMCGYLSFVLCASFQLLQHKWITGCLLYVESVTRCHHT
jgi:hypothetical protein